MVNERLNSYSPENADGNTENYDKSDFPPFNPDNARKLYEEAKASPQAAYDDFNDPYSWYCYGA